MGLSIPGMRPAHAQWRVDLAVAGAVTALTVAGAISADTDPDLGLREGGAVHLVLAGAMGVVLWWRRATPLAVFALSTACIATTAVAQWPAGWQPVAWFVAAFALGAHSTRPRALVGLGLGLAMVAGLATVQAPYFDSWLAVAVVLQLVVAWLLGVGIRASRTQREVSMRWADSAAQRAQLMSSEAAREERLRVARDLHDTVTNSLSAVTLQTTVLRRIHPGAAAEHLAAIEASGHAALADLRRMLGALRAHTAPAQEVSLRLTQSAGVQPSESPDGASLRAALHRVTGWEDEAPQGLDAPPGRTEVWTQWPVDVAFAVAVAAINVTGSVVPDPFDPTPYRDPNLPVLVLLASAPGLSLVLRRRWPVVPLALAVGVVVLFDALLWPHGNLPVTVLLAAFAVGAWWDLRQGAVAVAVAAAGVMAVHPFTPVGQSEGDLWLLGPLLLLPWVVGVAVRGVRLRADQAQQSALAAAARAGTLRAEAVAVERMRVARDLHDVVGHRLAEIVVQVVTARRVAGSELDDRLVAVESEARSAMDALRSMLDSLDTLAADDPPVSPAPGWADIPALAIRHRVVHGSVELTLDPTLSDASGGSAALTAYRVVQEALTNAARYAPAAALTVVVRVHEGDVEVVIEDDGRVPVAVGGSPEHRARGTGLGLIGLRERVALAGGTFEAGPRVEGGFRVRATLPSPGTGT